MRPERFRVLVLLASGLIDVPEAERRLYPSRLSDWLRRGATALVWCGVTAMVLLITAGAFAESRDWNPWMQIHFGCLPWNGPTAARHLHAIVRNLVGGL